MSRSRFDVIALLKVPLDMLLCAVTLLAAYALAARGIPFELSKGIPELGPYLKVLPVFLGVFLFAAVFFRLYRPRRAGSFGTLLTDILKVNGQAILIILAVSFYYREFSYSRLIMTIFFVLYPLLLFLHHLLWMLWEQHLYRLGVGTRKCLIVGEGYLAHATAERIEQNPWTGLSIVGFVSSREESQTAMPGDPRILGSARELERLVDAHDVEEVIVAVPFRQMSFLADIDQRLSLLVVGLRWVPDLEGLNTLCREVVDVDGLHLFNLRGVPVFGLAAFLKRSVDIVLSCLLLLLASPLLLLIAAVNLVTAGLPILYRQDRMGLDGRVFPLLKFRTMIRDAERQSGPVWAGAEDKRCTALGVFLRRTSLDELPQLWNVLLGHMSLVGPRPERPVFIEEFRRTLPPYMLRHRIKAGLTGWAQVNGWRGNTSLTKRLQFDLYYLKNWTIWFDLKILLLTLVRGWGRRWNAH